MKLKKYRVFLRSGGNVDIEAHTVGFIGFDGQFHEGVEFCPLFVRTHIGDQKLEKPILAARFLDDAIAYYVDLEQVPQPNPVVS